MRKPKAVALCRVSSSEQLENNSLNRQRDAVLKAADLLGVEIPENYWWSGSVSSKRGTNLNRKDLNEMLDACKKDKSIKYAIVDEPDRFMRSIDEAAYFEVTFRQLGVTVWYASDPELNKGDLASKLLKFTKYLSAEGSNEERQRKSINGQAAALREGRWTFVPKPGYMKGRERGIPEIHPDRGPALQKVLIDIATYRVTPSQGLIDLNKSLFMSDGHSSYKMDKFRKIVTDPFYAGILEIDKQVKVRNENGLHTPLITKEQHYELLRIMDNKPKNQAGPRKNGNPKYPANNIVTCDNCLDKRNGRVVGFDHTNGRSKKVYERYRCRVCGRSIMRQDLHSEIERQFKEYQLTVQGIEDLLRALEIVWSKKEGEAEQEVSRIRLKISSLNKSIAQQVEAATDPANSLITEEILKAISTKKDEVVLLEDQIDKLKSDAEYNKKEFLEFALNFLSIMSNKFLEVSHENRVRCKQAIFPAGFYLDENKKVYTPEISPFITLAAKKKDAKASDISHLVRVKRL